MNIEDIEPGTRITVNILVDSQPVSIRTKALMPYEGGLLVEPLEYRGHPVEAESDGSIDEFTDADGVKHQFRVDNMVPVHNWGKTFHKLYGAEIENAGNQRKAERYVVNLLGKVVINHTVTASVIVYDISMRGISLMIGKCPVQVKKGDLLTLTFRKNEKSKTMEVNCKVMRQFMVGTYPTVGCQMLGINADLLSFILETRNSKEAAKEEQSRSKITVREGGANQTKASDADDRKKSVEFSFAGVHAKKFSIN